MGSYTTHQEVEKFIEEYLSSRVTVETSVRAILNRALEYEIKFKKPFYDFTKEEALMMFKESHTISIIAVQNANTILCHAARWIKFEKAERPYNIYQEITKNDLKQCIDIEKKNSLLITRDQLTEIQNELMNDTDKTILEMLFLGVGGQWCKELAFLNKDNLSIGDKCLYFKTGKKIELDDRTINMLLDALNEDELVSYSGFMKITKVKSCGIYKLRNNALSNNDDPNDVKDQERRFRFLQRRLHIVGEYVGLELKASMIQLSGLLHYIKQGMEDASMSFREFAYSEQGRELARRYDIFSKFASSIMIEKFKEYFEQGKGE